MQSPAYMDKNSRAYAMAEKYLKMLYPGTMQIDATGRMTEPKYDMTLQQFNEAQDELDAALEESKQEAEAKYAETGQEIDVEDYVELEETIDVKVLMPDGRIVSSKPYKTKKDIEMNKVLTRELKNTIKQHEGVKVSPYLDSKRILTIGIGNNVSRLENFIALNLVDSKDGHTLSDIEKESLYSQIMTDVNSKTFSERNYSQYHVSASEIENKFNQQLEQSYHELERKFSNFNILPISVQQALLDMQFNMGSNKFSEQKWPQLFLAIRNQDWEKAATESHRRDIQQSRQDWTYGKFLDAI